MSVAARLLLVVALAGCGKSPSPVLVQPAAAVAPRHSPKSQTELPTTDSQIAVDNFLGLYQLAVASADKQPAQLVGLLLTHAQYFGRLEDYSRALAVAEKVVRAHPKVAEAYLQRASARQSLHDFAGAEKDLDRARALGADGDAIDSSRAAIFQALGRYDDALAVRQRLLEKRRTFATLAAKAQLLGEMGRTAEAEALFLDAQDSYDDVSPFPLAWLYFQEGLMEERAGRPSSARDFYEAAHSRLPIYAAATAHLAYSLAAGGERGRADALLDPLVESSDDPEYWGALAESRPELSKPAAERYDELVRRHPAAFADHAARFFIKSDPAKALSLARSNLNARATRDAYDLVIESSLAAGDVKSACEAADRMMALPHLTAPFRLRALRLRGVCTTLS